MQSMQVPFEGHSAEPTTTPCAACASSRTAASIDDGNLDSQIILHRIADKLVDAALLQIIASADSGDESVKHLTGVPSWRAIFAERWLLAARNPMDETPSGGAHRTDIYSDGVFATTPRATSRQVHDNGATESVKDNADELALCRVDIEPSSDSSANVDKSAKSKPARTPRPPRPLTVWAVPWSQSMTLATHIEPGRYRWNSGEDSVASYVFGREKASYLHRFFNSLGPLLGIPIWGSFILTIAAIFDPAAATDPSSWRPGLMALFSLLTGIPLRLILVSECAITPLKLILTTFDFWMPVALTLVSSCALADTMQWNMRSLVCVSVFLNLCTAQIIDSLPDRGASRGALLSQTMGALMTIFICVGVNAGWAGGLVFRPIFNFAVDSENLLSLDARFTSVSNLEVFRSAQSILITITVKVLLTNFMNPDDCTLLKTGCKILASANEGARCLEPSSSASASSPQSTPAPPPSTSTACADVAAQSTPASPKSLQAPPPSPPSIQTVSTLVLSAAASGAPHLFESIDLHV